jgi:hypothetical protein
MHPGMWFLLPLVLGVACIGYAVWKEYVGRERLWPYWRLLLHVPGRMGWGRGWMIVGSMFIGLAVFMFTLR